MGAAALILSLALVSGVTDANVEQKVAKILAEGETLATTSEARAAAFKKLKAMQVATAQSTETSYAYALAMLRQNRPSEALSALGRILSTDPTDLRARRLRTMILMNQRQYTAALAESQTLAVQLSKTKSTEPTADGLEAARLLGAMIGFLDGPGETFVKSPIRATNRTKIEKLLPAEYRDEYNNAARELTEAYVNETAVDATPTEVKETLLNKASAVAEKQADVVKDRNDTVARGEKLKDQMNKKWDLMTENWQLMSGELQKLTVRHAVLDQEYQNARMQHRDSMEVKKDKDNKPVLRETNQSAQWKIVASQIATQLAGLQQEIQITNNNLFALNAQMVALSAQGAEIGLKLEMEDQRLQRDVASLESKKQRIDKTAAAATKRFNEHKQAFSTYYTWDYEAEKQRLLESISTPGP